MASIDEMIRSYVASWNEHDPAQREPSHRDDVVSRWGLPEHDGRVRGIRRHSASCDGGT